jgi:nicotinamidase-related amidase
MGGLLAMTHHYERIILDVETQRDFFSPGGSLYNSTAAAAAKKIYSLFDWAKKEEIPVMSTVLRVRHQDTSPLSPIPHCLDETEGEQKLRRTILPSRINLGLLNTTDLPIDIFSQYRQVIFEKRDTDIFAHARAERLLTEMPITTFVIFGAGLANGICQAAIGLRTRGFGVIAADDAILSLDHPQAEMARMRMEAKGVVFARSKDIIVPTPRRRHRLVPHRTTEPARKAHRR